MVETVLYDFLEQYYLLRRKEGRIYADEEVNKLPEINSQHQHYQEWQIRKRSCQQLLKYLSRKNISLDILEVGCGNGWLSANLSTIPSVSVTGIDLNRVEIKQAQRVFTNIGNLKFLNCSLDDEEIKHRQFDTIVFAASIQYFSSLTDVLYSTLNILKPDGEIHILDSHFYNKNGVDSARERSANYYRSIGFPEMCQHYFHHSLEDIKLFNYEVLYNPHSFFNRMKKTKNPFPWICVKTNA